LAEAKAVPERVRRIVEKSSVGPITGPLGGLDLTIASRGFLESLRAFGVFDRLLQDNAMRRAPLGAKLAVVTAGATGDEVSAGAAKPISTLTIDAAALSRKKCSAILVVTQSLLDAIGSAGEALLGRELRVGCAAAIDASFLAGIVAPTTPVVSAGSFESTLTALFDALGASGSTSKLYLVLHPDVCRRACGMQGQSGPLYPQLSVSGGMIGTLPVLVSDELAAGEALLIDADQIAGDSEDVVLESARHTSLQMADNASPAESTAVSLWQTNSVALRAERFFSYYLMRPESVVRAVDIGVGSPA
jgi:hypothetical protein